MTGASTANGAIVTSRYSATLPRWASDAAAKNRVPASETAISASPAMCSAFTHSSWLSPLASAPSARLAACTRRAAARDSSRLRERATRVTVTRGCAGPAPPAAGIGVVGGRCSGVVSARSGGGGTGRREAGTPPWCRTPAAGRPDGSRRRRRAEGPPTTGRRPQG
ncbi:hypothetical protein [Blastococcus sp. TML/C7B]|uniref:hypothetical protein n=1 Tax=Blastococcus sp. TML/C7B TaxID=2798728 RepID=UPI001F5BBC40|nr:hypothetical protein [Blastococcus sp. TML/C7B]